MDVSKEIKKIMIDEEISIVELAKRLDTSQPNLSAKFKRNNFSVNEMKDIANKLGYELEIKFIKK